MVTENAIMNTYAAEYAEIEETDLDELETILQNQLEETIVDFDLLKEEREKIGNPDSLGQTVQDEIWKQRRIELWGEGFSMSDIMRLAKPMVRTHGSSTVTNWPAAFAFNIDSDDPYLLLRFPQRETNSNKAIPASANKSGEPPVSGGNTDLRDGVTD